MPLSTKQMEYLALAWACFESEPKIDYEKFRELAGLKTANSARELMRVTKNKLKSEYGPLSEGVQARNSKTPVDTPTKSTTPGKKGTAEKKTSGRKRNNTAAAARVDDAIDDDDFGFELADDSPAPIKKARREHPTHVKEEPDFSGGMSGENGYY